MQDNINQPKRSNIDTSENYINPYNFISLEKTGCKRKNKSEYDGDLTGYIECTLTTKTPIMIPDTREEKIKNEELNKGDFKSYIFSSYDEFIPGTNIISPVIPGSEIRGMLRSDFETFTNSCLSTVKKDKSFISRTKDAKTPGVLKKDKDGNWKLYEATRYQLHTTRKVKGLPEVRKAQANEDAIYMVNNKNRITYEDNKNVLPKEITNDLKTGDTVHFKTRTVIDKIKRKDGSTIEKPRDIANELIGEGGKTGILFIGELGVKKSGATIHDSIFVIKKDNEGNEKEVHAKDLNNSVKKLKEIFEMYNDTAFNKVKDKDITWYDAYDIDNAKVLPVWYSNNLDEKGRTYLSLAQVGKEAYHRTLNELLNVTGKAEESYMPCIDATKPCPTCGIFGFVNDDEKTDLKIEKKAVASKIRVADATYIGTENPYAKPKIIKELASPHISNTLFYSLYLTNKDLLNMKDNVDWNYDFEFNNDGSHAIKNITIRGRKAYWHHTPDENSFTEEKTQRNCEITPVKSNCDFKFKIYFENMNEEYLKKLIAVINLDYVPNNNVTFEGKPYYDLCHKIGKAKPLGYGSVKIKVNNVKIRNLSFDNNIVTYNIENYDKLDRIELNNQFDMETPSMQEAIRTYNFNYLKANYSDSKITYPLASSNDNGKVTVGSHFWFVDNKSTSMKNPYVLMVLPQILEGSEKLLGINGLNEKEKKVIMRNGNKVIIDGLKLPKYQTFKEKKNNRPNNKPFKNFNNKNFRR